MSNEFGSLLRRLRTEAGKTLVDIAELLRVSVPYVSDVERGRRSPFRDEILLQLATYLQADLETLRDSAMRSRDQFLLQPDLSPVHRDVGASLARHWRHLSPQALRTIEGVVNEEVQRGRK